VRQPQQESNPVRDAASRVSSGSNVGGYDIMQGTPAASGNYSIASFIKGTLTVNQAALTIAANNDSKVYGTSKTFFFIKGTLTALLRCLGGQHPHGADGRLREVHAVQEIFAVQVLPGSIHPDVINDQPRLIADAFVVPDEAPDLVSRRLRHAAGVTQ
jgi:hypothetical protein